MASISYTKFKFNQPIRLTEEEFYALKSIIKENPSVNINPSSESFYQTFQIETNMFLIGIICLGISFLDMWQWLVTTAEIVSFICLFGLISLFFQFHPI